MTVHTERDASLVDSVPLGTSVTRRQESVLEAAIRDTRGITVVSLQGWNVWKTKLKVSSVQDI